MTLLAMLDAALRRLEARLAHPSLARLRVRLRRRENLFLAALLAFGVLAMVLHWARAPATSDAPRPAASHAAAAAPPPPTPPERPQSRSRTGDRRPRRRWASAGTGAAGALRGEGRRSI